MVVSKIKGGADLMTPGLAGPPFPAGAKLGAVVAIASLENPSVPVAIGICTIDISTLQSARGAKGHAVEILHWAGDEVWDWSTSGKSGLTPPENLEGWIDESADNLAGDAENLKINDDEVEEGGVALPQADSQASQRNNGNPYVSGEDIVEVVDMDEEKDMTTEGTSLKTIRPGNHNKLRQPLEIDNAFRQAFFYGVHHHHETYPDQPKHGLTFPLSQSLVMSALVLPFLPAFTQKQTESLVIKKTSWKNARKYIKALDKQKLLLSKDRPGNEVDVLDIDFKDLAFQDFRPYKLPKKETGGSQSKNGTSTGAETGDDSIGQKLKRIELFRPKDSLAPLFETRYVTFLSCRERGHPN